LLASSAFKSADSEILSESDLEERPSKAGQAATGFRPAGDAAAPPPVVLFPAAHCTAAATDSEELQATEAIFFPAF
jgi:hypothetical protein